MSVFNRLVAILLTAALIGPIAPLQARTKKGDKFYAEGVKHENKKEWDGALESYEQALSEDPSEMVYQMAVNKTRFQAGQFHVEKGIGVRATGQLGEALVEFQKAYAMNPASVVAVQEIRETQIMIERERRRVEQTGKEEPPAVRALTPLEEARREESDKIDRILPVPELRPLTPTLMDFKMNGAKAKTVFETIGKVAGINVLWDSDYNPPSPKDSFDVDFDNTTVEQALDYAALRTKSFWKAVSPNTIFVTNDNPNKRRDYVEQVMRVFYLQNISLPAELQEVVNAVRTVPELTRVIQSTGQNAIIVRGEADQVELAAKLIKDLDKPKSEVMVDILVFEASSNFNKQITAAIASTGLGMPFNFTPRSSIQVPASTTNQTSTTGTGTTNPTNTIPTTTTPTTTTPTTGAPGTSIPLSQLGHLSSSDFSTTLPGALLQAALSDAHSKILQAPEMRAVDGVKSSLKIGQRIPTATGSFQPGVGGVGINPLVNTQFAYNDVGVNVDMIARVHDDNEVSIHLELEISTIAGQENLGGIPEPIIGQRKINQDFTMREGEIGLVGGLTTQQDDKTVTGIPGLINIPLIGHLFRGDTMDHNRDEIMIAVVPHIIRNQAATVESLRPIAVGNQSTIKLSYAPKAAVLPPPPAAPAPGAPNAPAQAGAPQPAAPAAVAAPGNPPAPVVPAANNAPPNAPPASGNPAAPLTPPATAPQTQPAVNTAPTNNAPPNTARTMLAPNAPPVPGNPAAPAAPPATAPQTPPATAPQSPPATAPPATAPPAPPVSVKPPQQSARVHFASPSVETAVSGTFTIALMVEEGQDVASAPMQIHFDPKILKLNDVTQGDFLANGGVKPVFTKNIQNDTGLASVTLNRAPGTPGVNGGGALINLNFQAVGHGTTAVTVPDIAVRNSAGQTVATGSPQLAVNVK